MNVCFYPFLQSKNLNPEVHQNACFSNCGTGFIAKSWLFLSHCNETLFNTLINAAFPQMYKLELWVLHILYQIYHHLRCLARRLGRHPGWHLVGLKKIVSSCQYTPTQSMGKVIQAVLHGLCIVGAVSAPIPGASGPSSFPLHSSSM